MAGTENHLLWIAPPQLAATITTAKEYYRDTCSYTTKYMEKLVIQFYPGKMQQARTK